MTPQPTINTFKVFKSKRLRKLAQEENPQACRGFKKRVVMIVRLLSFLRLVAACFAASPYIIYICMTPLEYIYFFHVKSHPSPSTHPSQIHLTPHPPHTPPTFISLITLHTPLPHLTPHPPPSHISLLTLHTSLPHSVSSAVSS